MYIHTTKSSPSTHWSCDGFAFQKSSTRVVRIQNSDHVIRETNWVTAGPGDRGTRFKRRTITSSQLEDITLVHYLGEVCTGVQASREVDLEEEQPNISTHVSPQSCNKQTLAKKEDKRKAKTTSPLFSNYPASNIKDTPLLQNHTQILFLLLLFLIAPLTPAQTMQSVRTTVYPQFCQLQAVWVE